MKDIVRNLKCFDVSYEEVLYKLENNEEKMKYGKTYKNIMFMIFNLAFIQACKELNINVVEN